MSINKLQIYNKEYNIVTPEEIDEVKEDVSGAVSTANTAKQESAGALEKANNSVSNLHSTITTVGIGWHELFSSSGAQISGILQIAATSAQEDHTSLTLSFNIENNSGGQVQASSSQIGYVSASEPFNRFATYYDKDKGKWRFFIELKTKNRLSVSYNLHNLVGSTGISYVNQFVSSIPVAAQDFPLIKGDGIIADRAIADRNGNNIHETYANKSEVQKIIQYTALATLTEPGWYRFAMKSIRTNDTFIIDCQKYWHEEGTTGCGALFCLSPVPTLFSATQLYDVVSSGGVGVDAIRIVGSSNSLNKPFYIDLRYDPNGGTNPIIMTITQISNSQGVHDSNWTLYNGNEVVKVNDEDIAGLPINIIEFNHTAKGIIADRALTVDPAVFTNHQVIKRYNVSTNDELDAAINDVYADVPEYSFFEFCISVKVSNIDLHGGTWYFKGFKGDINYGYIEGEIYRNYDEKVRRLKIQGAWTNFYKESLSIRRITNHIHATIQGEVEAFLNNCHVEAGDRTTYEASFGIGVAGIFELGGGSWYVRGYRPNESYGYQEIKKYADTGIFYYARSLNNGVWTPWKNMIPA